METVLFALLVICVMMSLADFPPFREDSISVMNVPCTNEFDNIQHDTSYRAECGEPMDVFIELSPKASYEHINPSAVWVKKCVGLCDYNRPGSRCIPGETSFEGIPNDPNMNWNRDKCQCEKFASSLVENLPLHPVHPGYVPRWSNPIRP